LFLVFDYLMKLFYSWSVIIFFKIPDVHTMELYSAQDGMITVLKELESFGSYVFMSGWGEIIIPVTYNFPKKYKN